MAEKDKPAAPEDEQSARHEPVIPGYWGPNMLIYGDISRLLFRMHRNVAAHMDAHRRLMERLQAVFQHEQAMVLELAKVIDEATTQAARKSNEGRPALGNESMERIFEHAGKAMQESGQMLTDIQLEALALLQHYIEEFGRGAAEARARHQRNKGTVSHEFEAGPAARRSCFPLRRQRACRYQDRGGGSDHRLGRRGRRSDEARRGDGGRRHQRAWRSLGKKLSLDVGDDACDPKQAVAVANKFAVSGVVFVAGHYCSSTSIPASAVYADAGIIEITPASTNPAYTDDPTKKGWINVFRICGRDDVQGKVAGTYIATHFKGKPVAIVDDKTTYGKGLADETRKALRAAGVKEVLDESINQGDKDFSALVSKMKQANVGVIYFGGYYTEAGLIVRQAKRAGAQRRAGGRRCARHHRVLEDHGRCRQGHAHDLLTRSAQHAERAIGRRRIQEAGLRPGRLYALHLCRGASLRRGGRAGEIGKDRGGIEGAP